MKIKSILSYLSLAVVFGLLLPAILAFFSLYSCPHSGDLAYFPLFSAQCPGEFVSTLGLIILAFPGIAAGVGFTYIVYTLSQAGIEIPIFGQMQGETQLIVTAVFSAIINIAVYWFAIRVIAINFNHKFNKTK